METTHWDDAVPEEITEGWNKIKNDLLILSSIDIKRCIYHGENESHYELITCTDAAKRTLLST